jgi:thiol-disulfide isomerase/thioredoxin
MTARLRPLLLAGVLLLGGGALAACSSSASPSAAKAGTCLAPVSATAPASTAAASTAAATAGGPVAVSQDGKPLPTTKLGCLDGSGDVTLTSVGRPMIVSFWATYCPPCQAETPVVEAFAKANAGTVAVVGVDSGDDAGKAKSFVSDFGMTYPIVSDPTTGLLKSVATPELPRLLFVTADGKIAYSYASNQLTAATLDRLVTTYLGVRGR